MGCVGKFLVLCFFLVLSILVLLYGVTFHTAVPLRMAARALELLLEPQHLQIRGIGGTLHSGFQFESAQWVGGEITDFSIRYKNFLFQPAKGIWIQEIRFSKFHAEIHGPRSSADTAPRQVPTAPDSASAVRSSSFGGLFIEKAELKDIRLTDSGTGFHLKVDFVECLRFSVGPKGMTLGGITVLSDSLELKSGASDPEVLQFDVTLLPKLHPDIRNPIPLTLVAGIGAPPLPPPNIPASQLITFVYPVHADPFLRTEGLDLRPFLNIPAPGKFSCQLPLKNSPESFPTGSFKLGTRLFQISRKNSGQEPALFGTSTSGKHTLLYSLTLSQTRLQQTLESIPPKTPNELLAHLFFSRSPQELSQAERQEVQRLEPLFDFPQPP